MFLFISQIPHELLLFIGIHLSPELSFRFDWYMM